MNLEQFSPAAILALVVGLALLPFVAVMVTAFAKLVVVLSLLRSALGLQQTPPNMVVNGLAIILSIYVMYPVGLEMTERVRERLQSSAVPASLQLATGNANVSDGPGDALSRMIDVAAAAKEPLRDFLVRHTATAEREFFLETARRLLPQDRRADLSRDDLVVVVPAFTVSELARAFQIGFLIFLPFLAIDLIVASVLQALGMMMLSPTVISLPFKLLLFVVLDGWSRLIHGLVVGY